jgi:hypothetical protein
MSLQLAWVIAKPIASVLLAGVLRTLLDVQGGQHWGPAVVDGLIVALYAAGGLLGVSGAQAGVQKVQTARTAAVLARQTTS